MTNAPRFLDKLVNMTAIHDLELMEYSLLKTLEEFIKPRELLILKFDRNGIPNYQLTLKKEKYEIIWDDIVLTEEIQAGIEIVSRTKKPFSRELNETNLLTVWHVIQPKAEEVFLVTTTRGRLNNLDSHMINGLLAIYRNFYAVLSDSQLDTLTGLPNRKTFEETISKIYLNRPLATEDVPVNRRTDRNEENTKFWLGMADIDCFKRINDNWGHLYGDEVLLLVAQLMQAHFRDNDFLFRFGGEEFVIILNATTKERALMAFDRFRTAMAEYSFPQIGQVTISIGVIEMDPSIFTATLLDRADKALYHAKRNGRNQTWEYGELLEKGLVEEKEITFGDVEFF